MPRGDWINVVVAGIIICIVAAMPSVVLWAWLGMQAALLCFVIIVVLEVLAAMYGAGMGLFA